MFLIRTSLSICLIGMVASTCQSAIVTSVSNPGGFGTPLVSGGDTIVFSPTILVPSTTPSALAKGIVFTADSGFEIDTITITQETVVGVFAGGEVLSAMTLDGEVFNNGNLISSFVDMDNEIYTTSSSTTNPESFSITLSGLNADQVSLNLQSSLFASGFASGYLPTVTLQATSNVVAVPEPSAFTAIFLLCATGLCVRRTRD